ncbi:MAG TPA: carbamoyltransferase C-terminal domain-containing protein [Bryobacteraceae bacterium]|nr:carbamoyltransferase C-terminal domain-containing protein [Bryobacteraceae bacterium]
MIILGLGGLVNDAACAILIDGTLVAAVEQKKIARRQRPGELPAEAIASCLSVAGIKSNQVDCVAVARPLAAGPEAVLHLDLRTRFANSRMLLVDHHAAHAASAFYASPFNEARVLTLDRTGDFTCGALWRASANRLELLREIYYPDSLGSLYGRVTELLGFEANADEHKVQWLSTAGGGQFVPLFREILRQPGGASGSVRLEPSFFDGTRTHRGGFSGKFFERLGLDDDAPIPASMKAEVAAGVQKAVEEIVVEMAGSGENLCLAGGLFFNALLVRVLETSSQWKNVLVQPAAGNVGTALGAVFYAWHVALQKTGRAVMPNLFLGPIYTAEAIKQVLENCKLRFRYLVTTDELLETAVRLIGDNKIVAWMHGRMEFGPRALGNRSILASPLNPYSTENLNIYIKHREPFRKFAASVPSELAREYFETGPNARFLATVGRVRPAYRKTFESAVLGEDLVRVHTVEAADNPLYHKLLHAAGKSTGLPVLYNTSFNLFSDPIVCTPRDAVRSFYSSGIDALFVGNFLVEK